MPPEKLETYYGLPADVKYCKRCVISNQRPASTPEFRNTSARKIGTMSIDAEGVCDACRFADIKEQIDWEAREQELVKLLDQHRSNDGSYDCLVPGSGGKDSALQSHILKYKYGMLPLTCTWPPILYTDIGWKNYRDWCEVGGFDNITFKQNGRVMKLLTRLSIENLLHPFQSFILGQKNLAPKIAAKFGIPLVFYGENEAEYGNPIADNNSSLRDKSYHTADNLAFELEGQGVRVSTASTATATANNGGKKTKPPQAAPAARQFATSMTRYFADTAARLPVFAQLQNLIGLAVVAELLAERRREDNRSWTPTAFLDENAYGIATAPVPKFVPSLANYRLVKNRHWLISVSGGVEVNPRTITGRCCGIHRNGSLIIETDHGTETLHSATTVRETTKQPGER